MDWCESLETHTHAILAYKQPYQAEVYSKVKCAIGSLSFYIKTRNRRKHTMIFIINISFLQSSILRILILTLPEILSIWYLIAVHRQVHCYSRARRQMSSVDAKEISSDNRRGTWSLKWKFMSQLKWDDWGVELPRYVQNILICPRR